MSTSPVWELEHVFHMQRKQAPGRQIQHIFVVEMKHSHSSQLNKPDLFALRLLKERNQNAGTGVEGTF